MALSGEHDSDLEQAIINYEKTVQGEGAILTGWVLVAEFIDRNGDPMLSSYARTGMPYWRISGMIDAAPSVMDYAEDEDLD
jgi:hypothetical protein